jgi:hypothetical protein
MFSPPPVTVYVFVAASYFVEPGPIVDGTPMSPLLEKMPMAAGAWLALTCHPPAANAASTATHQIRLAIVPSAAVKGTV